MPNVLAHYPSPLTLAKKCFKVYASQLILRRFAMKKLKPHEVRGKAAEKRFMTLARSVKIDSVEKVSVWPAGRLLDRNGVDFTVYFRTESAHVHKVPVQVKSSFSGVLAYRRKYEEHIRAGIVTIVVNDFRTDEHIMNELKMKFMNLMEQGVDFTEFFAQLRTKRVRKFYTEARSNRREFRTVRRKEKGIDHVDERLFCVCESECEGGNCKLSCLAL